MNIVDELKPIFRLLFKILVWILVIIAVSYFVINLINLGYQRGLIDGESRVHNKLKNTVVLIGVDPEGHEFVYTNKILFYNTQYLNKITNLHRP